MKILVTGGAGFIGSHICLELLSAGHSVIIVDNLNNSLEKTILTICSIFNIELNKDVNSEGRLSFFNFDIGSVSNLKELFLLILIKRNFH